MGSGVILVGRIDQTATMDEMLSSGYTILLLKVSSLHYKLLQTVTFAANLNTKRDGWPPFGSGGFMFRCIEK